MIFISPSCGRQLPLQSGKNLTSIDARLNTLEQETFYAHEMLLINYTRQAPEPAAT
jgi:hypothetical protein